MLDHTFIAIDKIRGGSLEAAVAALEAQVAREEELRREREEREHQEMEERLREQWEQEEREQEEREREEQEAWERKKRKHEEHERKKQEELRWRSQWRRGDYVAANGCSSILEVADVEERGIQVRVRGMAALTFIAWERFDACGIRRVNEPEQSVEEPAPIPAAQPQPAPAAPQPAPPRRYLFEPHEIAAMLQPKSCDVSLSPTYVPQPSAPSYTSTSAPALTAQPNQDAAMAQTDTQRQTEAFHQRQQQSTYSSSRTVETHTQYGSPAKQPT